ncbi:MAG: hypothetical protein U1C46_11020 [Bacteroidales bacterium]|nr:hypothetical protein [Bacteroidales bacterium]
MKTKKITIIGIWLALLAIVLSCNKDRLNSNTDQNPDLLATSIKKIVSHANQKYLSVEINVGNESRPYLAVNDGLIDEYIAKEQFLGTESNPSGNRLIACLMVVELNEIQVPHVRRALITFENRNLMIINKHREAFMMLHSKIEARRLELIQLLTNGVISPVEFQRQMFQLRQHFIQGLMKIKKSNAEAFSKSFRILM